LELALRAGDSRSSLLCGGLKDHLAYRAGETDHEKPSGITLLAPGVGNRLRARLAVLAATPATSPVKGLALSTSPAESELARLPTFSGFFQAHAPATGGIGSG